MTHIIPSVAPVTGYNLSYFPLTRVISIIYVYVTVFGKTDWFVKKTKFFFLYLFH